MYNVLTSLDGSNGGIWLYGGRGLSQAQAEIRIAETYKKGANKGKVYPEDSPQRITLRNRDFEHFFISREKFIGLIFNSIKVVIKT